MMTMMMMMIMMMMMTQTRYSPVHGEGHIRSYDATDEDGECKRMKANVRSARTKDMGPRA